MRIYSKFHDYYDIGLQHGIDPNCVYKRETKRIATDNNEWDKYYPLYNAVIKIVNDSPYVHLKFVKGAHFILFCGRIYFCLEYFHEYYDHYKYCTQEGLIYTVDDAHKYLAKHYNKGQLDKELNEKSFFDAYTIAEFMEKFPTDRDERVVNLLTQYGIPVIDVKKSLGSGSSAIILNPCLKDFQFYRMVDPVTAFQEISMFISGILGGTAPPMVEVSDVVRLEKHGFDKKISFRKGKEKK